LLAEREKADPDAVDFNAVDWTKVDPVELELDPTLIEQIHSRRRLKSLTLRVGAEQIAEAKRVATRTGTKYQAVLRRWLAEGASRARSEHLKLIHGR
jgi:hypothetical protein